jgi:hypothetical protein
MEEVIPVTAPHAIDFVVHEIVPAADAMHALYIQAKDTLAAWYAREVSALIPNDNTPVGSSGVISGSPLTGAKATNIIVRLQEFVNDMEQFGNAKLNTVIAVSRR